MVHVSTILVVGLSLGCHTMACCWAVIQWLVIGPSNHPPPSSNMRQLPASISTRLTNISHDVDVLRDAAPSYNKALRDSGYTNDVEYLEGRNNKEPISKRKHVREVTRFNPPYSKNVTTKVGLNFLKLNGQTFLRSFQAMESV